MTRLSNMSHSLSLEVVSATEIVTTAQAEGASGGDHTATGIPISLLWMPYVGFSLVLIILMVFSFLHYHRKHGHKYHHQQQFWGSEMSVASVLESIQHQVVNLGRRPRQGDNEHVRSQKNTDNKKADKDAVQRSKGIGYRGVEEYIPPPASQPQNLPPNGGLHINRNTAKNSDNSAVLLPSDTPKPQQSEGTTTTRRLLPAQPTTHPGHINLEKVGHRPRLRNPQCDEPSTSSSTVSSKTSNQSNKPGRNRPPQNRRHKRPLVFESNHNGSMVDVRVDPKDSVSTFELKPTPRDRGPPAHGDSNTVHLHHSSSMSGPHSTTTQRHISSHPKSNTVDGSEPHYRHLRNRSPKNNCNTWEEDAEPHHQHHHHRHHQPHAQLPNNPHSSNINRPLEPDEISLYEDRKSRSSSLPIWSTMPLCPKPAPPKRDIYSYPFTPSGHMEMLSDTENDEVFLLQHTKL